MAFRPSRNLLILGVAGAFGLAAAWLAARYLDERVADLERRHQQPTARAVVPKIDLPAGSLITHDTVAEREVPLDWLHSSAITPEQFERAAGSVLAYPARSGEPLVWPQLEGRRSAGFAARVAPGRRAATLPVDEISSMSGMLEPGDVIDLLVTVQRDPHNLTLPLLQGVSVLATGARLQPGGSDPQARSFGTITLDLDPEQAAQVVAARTVGKLTALLRAPGDRSPAPAVRTDALALLGLAAPPPPASRAVPVIYGGSHNPLLEVGGLPPPAASAATD